MNCPDGYQFSDTDSRRVGSRGAANRRGRFALVLAGMVLGLLNVTCRAGGAPVPSKVTATDVQRFTVYHSPQTPGYTCWAGTWVMPDETLMISFHQATGPITG